MVLEIRLSNFYSIKEEVMLDLRAGNIQSKRVRSLTVNTFRFDDVDVLKTVALYGANASGKSNVIKAIRFCHHLVLQSHQFNENTVYNQAAIRFAPFKFKGYSKKPSTYFIRFVANQIEYEYSFSLRQSEILTESLYHYPNGRRAKVFERDEQAGKTKKEKYSFGTSVIKRPLDVAESTSNKTLYISRASQMDREIPKLIYRYFNETFILNYFSYSIQRVEAMTHVYHDDLLRALQLADSDIVNFKLRVKTEPGKNLKVNVAAEEAVFEDTVTENLEIKTYHKSSPNTSFDFMTEESLGTQKLFFMMLTMLDIVKNNKVLLIDEIEDSLHAQIVDYILQIFHASQHAQLIFSTHNTHLLDLGKLRKDQIWFVNKDKDGSSDLYSLYDYNDFRDTMNLEKAYLQGRFDAVPIIDDSSEELHALTHG